MGGTLQFRVALDAMSVLALSFFVLYLHHLLLVLRHDCSFLPLLLPGCGCWSTGGRNREVLAARCEPHLL
jgi:hypothetical protein